MAAPKRILSQPAHPSSHDVATPTAVVTEIMQSTPLLPGEDRDQFRQLAELIAAALKPTDAIAAMYVNDIVQEVWNAKRLGTFRAYLMTSQHRSVVRDALINARPESMSELVMEFDADHTLNKWEAGDPEAIRAIARLFPVTANGLDPGISEALLKALPNLDRVDRMVSASISRRDSSIRELDRWRQARERKTVTDVQDGEP